MPTYRTTGDICYPGVITIKADSLDAAIEVANDLENGLKDGVKIIDVGRSYKLAAFRWDGGELEEVMEDEQD